MYDNPIYGLNGVCSIRKSRFLCGFVDKFWNFLCGICQEPKSTIPQLTANFIQTQISQLSTHKTASCIALTIQKLPKIQNFHPRFPPNNQKKKINRNKNCRKIAIAKFFQFTIHWFAIESNQIQNNKIINFS